jgi:hypothetical protein
MAKGGVAAILARWLATVVPAGCTVSAAAGAVTTAFRSPVASITVDVAAIAGSRQQAGVAAAVAFAVRERARHYVQQRQPVLHDDDSTYPLRS